MAEVYLRHPAVDVKSAGIEAHGLNPFTLRVLQEDGQDTSNLVSQTISEYEGQTFDYVFTVCDQAREHCPYFPAQKGIKHHSFPDPARVTGSEAEKLIAFRAVRDEIKAYCRAWLTELTA